MTKVTLILSLLLACYIAGSMSTPVISTKPLAVPPHELTEFIDSKEVVVLTNHQYSDREEFWSDMAAKEGR